LHRAASLAIFAALLAVGCGGRHPAATTVPPPPAAGPAAPVLRTGPLPAPSLTQPFEPGAYSEQGMASWYGLPFHGRRASNGEIFDMNQPVAAHRTLPFGSVVRVTNLSNGLTVDVRIIDRGPFVANRIIDLSMAAAQSIKLIGPGTAPVRIELVSSAAPLTGYFAVQIGAFQQRANADRLRATLVSRYPVAIQEYESPGGHFYRVRVGREISPAAAQQLALTLASDGGYQTFVVRLDDATCGTLMACPTR
jgi:rare lipoprotein A